MHRRIDELGDRMDARFEEADKRFLSIEGTLAVLTALLGQLQAMANNSHSCLPFDSISPTIPNPPPCHPDKVYKFWLLQRAQKGELM